MSIRIGDYIEWGCLYHSHRNSTHGYLGLRGMETPIAFELVGDPAPDLIGKALRFEPRDTNAVEPVPKDLRLQWRQAGPTGLITIERGARFIPRRDGEYDFDAVRGPD